MVASFGIGGQAVMRRGNDDLSRASISLKKAIAPQIHREQEEKHRDATFC